MISYLKHPHLSVQGISVAAGVDSFSHEGSRDRSDFVDKYSSFLIPLWDISEVCSVPSFTESLVGLKPSYPRGNLLIFFGFPSFSVSLSYSFAMLSGDILSDKVLAPKSLIQHLLCRIPKSVHFQSSSPITPFHAPLNVAGLNYKLDVPCSHPSMALFFLCLFPKSPSRFYICYLFLFKSQLRFHLLHDKHRE